MNNSSDRKSLIFVEGVTDQKCVIVVRVVGAVPIVNKLITSQAYRNVRNQIKVAFPYSV